MSRYGRPLALEEISPEYLRNREAALNQCGTPAVNHDPLVFCGVRQRRPLGGVSRTSGRSFRSLDLCHVVSSGVKACRCRHLHPVPHSRAGC